MIDFALATSGILASDEDFSQIIVIVIMLAIGLIGNISKAKAKKTTVHTGKNRPDRKPTDQRRISQKQPRTGVSGETTKIPKYYAPGGFAEVLQDEALEKTLSSRSNSIENKKIESQIYTDNETSTSNLIQPIERIEIMDSDLKDMGHLDSLEDQIVSQKPRGLTEEVTSRLISFDDPEDLAMAVLYSEILAKPVGLREI